MKIANRLSCGSTAIVLNLVTTPRKIKISPTTTSRLGIWSDPNFSGVSIEAGPGDYADIRQIYPDFNDVASSIQVLIG